MKQRGAIVIAGLNIVIFVVLLVIVEVVLRLRSRDESFSPWVVDASLSYYEMFTLRPGRGDGVSVERVMDVTTRRRTPTNPQEGLKVFMFGGSTTVGGPKDNETIASHLAVISVNKGLPIVVQNFGVGNFRSSEEMMKLIKLLRAGARPDLVVFYDGFNDTEFAANGQVRYGMLKPIDDVFRKDVSVYDVEKVLSGFQLYNILRVTPLLQGAVRGIFCRAVGAETVYSEEPIDSKDISDFGTAREYCVETYTSNIRMVRALGREYGFQTMFILQPMIYFKRNLTTEEVEVFESVPQVFKERVPVLYTDLKKATQGQSDVYVLTDVFDEMDETIFGIDQGHIHSEGRRIVAERIFDLIESGYRGMSTQSDR